MATKRVSIEEYLASKGYGGVARKNFALDSGVILKGTPLDLGVCDALLEKAGRSFDKEKGTIAFVMSAEIEDRDRDIVVQEGLDTAQFEKNPVAPWGHNARDMPVGKWSDLTKNLTGRPKRTEGILTLTMADPQAARLASHFEAKSIRACSIGFMPKEIERRDVPDDQQGSYFYPGYMIHSADLYECSPCSIPANPAALAKAAADGDVMARETIERVLDTWTIREGVIMPKKAFEDAADTGRTLVVMGGERFVAFKDASGTPVLEKAADVKKGDFVSWGSSGGTARGKVDSVKMDGDVVVDGATVTGTADDPAAKISVYSKGADGWAASGVKVAHKCSTLTKIDALKEGGLDEDEGVIATLKRLLGISDKSKTGNADPAPGDDGPKPAPEPTPGQKAARQMLADSEMLEAKLKMKELENDEAELLARTETLLSD